MFMYTKFEVSTEGKRVVLTLVTQGSLQVPSEKEVQRLKATSKKCVHDLLECSTLPMLV